MTLTLNAVGPVDAGGLNADQHLCVTGLGHRASGRFQNLRPAGFGDFDAFHFGWERHGVVSLTI
jgi:hypothetical protein